MKLTEATSIGSLRLKNRMIMAPLKTAMGELGGRVTDNNVEFYRTVARGGVAMVITEPMAVQAEGREHPRQLAIHDDSFAAGLESVVAAIHEFGALACCHLNHAGAAANPKVIGGTPVGPSKFACPTSGVECRELGEGEIDELLKAWSDAARRAADAGYDAIEVQMGHGYLVSQFLSPSLNTRRDAWGGSLEGRLKFAEAVLDAVMAGAPGLPIIVRVSASETGPSGPDWETLSELLRLLKGRGVAAVHVGMGSACHNPPWYYSHMSLPPEVQEDAVRRILYVADLPVIVAGRMGDPERAEKFVQMGAAAVAMAKPLIADHDLPNKVAAGLLGSIARCGSCLQGCLAAVKAGGPVGCILNPAVGKFEPVKKAGRELSVVVVGGGPAGMTAAWGLALAGHKVELWEAGEELGGQFALAWKAPGKRSLKLVLESMERRVRSAGVQVILGREATAESVAAAAPDLVVVATGAVAAVPPVEGLQDAGAISGIEFFRKLPDLADPVLVIGGGMVGMEAAELLAERGKRVVVVELLGDIARDMEMVSRKLLMKKLPEMPIEVHTNTKVVRVGDGRAVLKGEDGREWEVEAASVVYAVGTKPHDQLSDKLRNMGLEVRVAGDALRLAQVVGAVQSAWEIVTEHAGS